MVDFSENILGSSYTFLRTSDIGIVYHFPNADHASALTCCMCDKARKGVETQTENWCILICIDCISSMHKTANKCETQRLAVEKAAS